MSPEQNMVSDEAIEEPEEAPSNRQPVGTGSRA